MSKAEDLAKVLYPDWKTTDVPTVDGLESSEARIQRVAYTKGYYQAEKDMLSKYGWLVLKVKALKLKYCHNREAVKAIEEACDILNEFNNSQR